MKVLQSHGIEIAVSNGVVMGKLSLNAFLLMCDVSCQ